MESLKQIGELCRQHYEKFLLTLALLGLAFAAWVLYNKGEVERRNIQEVVEAQPLGKQKKVTPLDLSTNAAVRARAQQPPDLNFSPPHNLLNPVKWQRRPDGSLLKIQTGEEVGVAQMKVTRIQPLYYRISLDRFSPVPGGLPNIFYLSAVDEASARNPRLLRRSPFYLNTTDNRKNDIVLLQTVQGTEEDPELVMELVENQEKITVSKSKPYERVSAYEADLLYTVNGRKFERVREGDELKFGGEDYKIIAIKADEVVLLALLNDKKHTVRYSAGG